MDELVEESTVFGDHLEMEVAATPWINVALGEVGPNASKNRRQQSPTGGLMRGVVKCRRGEVFVLLPSVGGWRREACGESVRCQVGRAIGTLVPSLRNSVGAMP